MGNPALTNRLPRGDSYDSTKRGSLGQSSIILAVILVVLLFNPPVAYATHFCGGQDDMTTLSYKQNKTAWEPTLQEWHTVNAYWPWEWNYVATSGSCQDVNVRVPNSQFPSVGFRTMYFNSSSQWIWGAAGWLQPPTGTWAVTVSSIANGTPIWTCANVGSTWLDIHT